jgi:hypothetical protein
MDPICIVGLTFTAPWIELPRAKQEGPSTISTLDGIVVCNARVTFNKSTIYMQENGKNPSL